MVNLEWQHKLVFYNVDTYLALLLIDLRDFVRDWGSRLDAIHLVEERESIAIIRFLHRDTISQKGVSPMSVIIKRKAMIFRGFTRLEMKLNGKAIGTISNGEKREINVPYKNSCLQVTQFGGKSNELSVSDGDMVLISTAAWTGWGLFLIAIIVPMMVNSFDGLPQVSSVMLTFVMYLSAFWLVYSFKLTKLTAVNELKKR
ncbi:hypothetical protein SAMN04488100_1204 [Alkalibacterium putridalgicola]|uniref:Uncharacterized protein n=2 Tax=Alkalibacterium putridalgicola TaxID=426703 RepID=A0A1H7UW14_9LACT|nr:hypothetical protein SAMN04488100_1204 [Alkalibacterium putridalgicola]